VGDHIDRRGEEGPHAGLGGSMTQGERQMGLSQAVAGDEHQPFVVFYKSELKGFHDFGLWDEGRMFPVESFQRPGLGELGGAQAGLHLALKFSGSLNGQQAL